MGRRPLRPRRRRLRRRLIRHHLPLAAASAAATAALASAVGALDDTRPWSVATAYVGLALLAATLLVGPRRVARRRRLPLSDDIRRDLGIWSAIAGIAHVVLGFQVHLGGRILAYFPANLFGLANVLGLAAAAILATLLALSNDRSIARLGGRRWKRAHRLSYPLLGLVLLHGVIYLQQEGRILPLLLVLAAVGGVVVAAQLAGAARVRAGEVAPFSGR